MEAREPATLMLLAFGRIVVALSGKLDVGVLDDVTEDLPAVVCVASLAGLFQDFL